MTHATAHGLNLCIVRRQSPDWLALTPAAFAAQSRPFYRMIGLPEDQGIKTAELWDRTFAISFCEARQAMKDIATKSLRSVERASVFTSPADIPAANDGATICCFVDDDDWLRPDAQQILAAHATPEYDGYVWRQIRCGRSTGDWLKLSLKDAACGTNNYAVNAEFFRRDAANLERVYQHFVANDVFPSLRVRVIEGETLTATNRHPASTMFLDRGLDGVYEPERLAAMVDHYNRRMAEPPSRPPAPGIAWVLPWVDEVRRFYLRLAASRQR